MPALSFQVEVGALPTSWVAPTRVLIERVSPDLSGVWSLLYAAELAAFRLGSVPGRPAPGLFAAGTLLRDAVEDLEWFHPDLAGHSAAVDLGPVEPIVDAEGAEGAVRELLDAAIQIVTGVVADPLLAGEDVLMLARVVGLVVDARRQATEQVV